MKVVADRQVAHWGLRLLSAFLFAALVFTATVVPAISYHPHPRAHGPQEHHTARQWHDRGEPVEPTHKKTTQLESLCASIDGCHPAGHGPVEVPLWTTLFPGGESILDRATSTFASADLAPPLRPPDAWPSWNDEGWRPWPTGAQARQTRSSFLNR